ncbi:MAG: hypothetical protein GY754_32520 [bacterium]|nr:hypothetical protein [bacterium]
MNKNGIIILFTFLTLITICFSPGGLGAREKKGGYEARHETSKTSRKKQKEKGIIKRRVAVLGVAANNVPLSYAAIVRNSVELFLYSGNNFLLLERDQINRVLSERKIGESYKGDTSRALLVGKTLAADFVIVGSIDKLDDYKISIRVVSINEARILIAYSQTFSSLEDIDPVVDKLSGAIERDILKYLKTGKIQASFYDNHNIYFSARFNYIFPLRKFDDIVSSGYGFTLDCGIYNLLFDNSTMGIETGFYAFSGQKNSSDSCYFVPLLFKAAYRIPVLRRFYIAPEVAGGISLLTLVHDAGEGFDMSDNSQRNAVEPMVQGGIQFGVAPFEMVDIRLGARYGVLFEKGNNMDFINFNLGVVFVF